MHASFDLGSRRKKEDVGRGHAVHRGYERHRDTVPHFLDVRQILHHLDQPQHRADNADRGRIPARGLKHLGFLLRVMFLETDLKFHGFADHVQVRTIHRQVERFAQERILDSVGFVLERNNSALARFGGVPDDLLDHGVRVLVLVEKDHAQFLDRPDESVHGSGDHHGADCPAQDDDGRRHLRHVPDLAAFHHQPA